MSLMTDRFSKIDKTADLLLYSPVRLLTGMGSTLLLTVTQENDGFSFLAIFDFAVAVSSRAPAASWKLSSARGCAA